ncbi:MAG: UDP-N-acetylglucosamine 2-epimerase [Candidatus Omnitrophica bacterium]|nr:UDP-N-acetylglucosamine 2-epimerase [Candidatus Omnitrophota bacterium]
MKKRILIIHASAGAGHRKAAESIHHAFETLPHGEYSVELVNALDLTNNFFKKSYERSYLWMITRTAWLWGVGYYWFDVPWMKFPVRVFRRVMNGINTGSLRRYLERERYDVIISTHFLATEVVNDLKRRKRVHARLITVVTDLGAHVFWILPEVDYYVAGVEATRLDLEKRGIGKEKIKVMGIPVRESFARSKEPKKLREQMGLKEGVFTSLLIGGGAGVGPIEKIVEQLSSLPIQLLIVCGQNEALYRQLVQRSLTATAALKPLGYVNNVDELMAVSDCVITKSGGLTVSEALASDLPLIIIDPIPGQERKNCEIIVRGGAGIEAKNSQQVLRAVQDFMWHPEKLQKMREKAKELAHPNAAKEIAELAVRLAMSSSDAIGGWFA